MTNSQIRFDDGAGYERFMGVWSQRAGAQFLDWLAAAPGRTWLDVGCGNGAFTELVVERCAPAAVCGIDPSAAQIAYARGRPALRTADLREGDALALPWPGRMFDVAVMPLVIFFVPDPARGVAEMARVVRPGGLVAAYAWDMPGGGFPYEALLAAMREMGMAVPAPPHPEASRLDAMESLWTTAGLRAVETASIAVQRVFDDFDDYWITAQGSPSVGSRLEVMTADDRARLMTLMRARLPADAAGRITCSARAHAAMGRVAP